MWWSSPHGHIAQHKAVSRSSGSRLFQSLPGPQGRPGTVQEFLDFSTLTLPHPNLHYWYIQMNGSREQSRKCHFEWNFQVCQNPPKLRKPTCVTWKEDPVLFFSLKAGRKGLKFPPPPSIAPPPENMLNLHSWDVNTLCETEKNLLRFS